MISSARLALLVAMLSLLAAPTRAETVAEFYKDKTIRLIVGSAPGGGSDVYARTFAKYFTEHMPGKPAVIIQNLPAAGGVIAASQIANTMARDGTVIGTVMRSIPFLPLLSDTPLNFDPRAMNWLGSLNRETNVIITWHTSPTKTLDDLFKRETIIGASGNGTDTEVYTVLMNRTLGTKMKLVTGYPGGPAIDLAMQRGEVEGRVSITWTSLKGARGQWITDKQINVIGQMALQRNPEIADVPNILELVKDPLDRQIYEFFFARQEAGRPFVAPPDVPADRLAALRKAFAEAAKDKGFIKETEAKGGSVELMDGAELQAFVEKATKTPPEVVKAVKAYLKAGSL